jgi:5'(3')-deoxyribonucleotidase
MKTVLIDVDLTLVDTLNPWLRWFKARTGVDLTPSAYNIENQMKEHMVFEDPMDYWREKDIYNGLTPYEASAHTIHKLVEKGFQIVFVTWSPFSEQITPKEDWLAEHFGSDIPVIHTSHKELIDGDILIDDNTEMLTKFLNRDTNNKRVGLKYETSLNSSWYAPYPQKSLSMYNWASVQEFFHDMYGVKF